MKCKNKDKIIASAKRTAKKLHNAPYCARMDDGRGIYSYAYLSKDWDPSISGIEFSFKRGSQYIYVDVVTPTVYLYDLMSALAHEKYPLPDHLGIRTYKSTPNYRRLGKNKKRKRIVSYTMNMDEPVDSGLMKFSEWSKLVDTEIESILDTGSITVKPSIRIEQFRYGKYVTIVSEVPYDITYKDLAKCAHKVESLLDGACISEVFGETVYGSVYYRESMRDYETRRVFREQTVQWKSGDTE